MIFNIQNREDIKTAILANTSDSGAQLLSVIKKALDTVVSNNPDTSEGVIYIDSACKNHEISQPNTPHYKVKFTLVSRFAAVGTVYFET